MLSSCRPLEHELHQESSLRQEDVGTQSETQHPTQHPTAGRALGLLWSIRGSDQLLYAVVYGVLVLLNHYSTVTQKAMPRLVDPVAPLVHA